MNENLIYRLRIKHRPIAATYPTFKIWDADLFYFPTKEAAEEKIHEFEWEPNRYCFIIEACPIGRNVEEKAYRRWVYDDEGDFISETLCSEFEDLKTRAPEEYFPGRRPDQCRFKPGDCVELVFQDTVTLGIIMECPPTPEDMAKIGCADYEQDVYQTLTGKVDLHLYSQYDQDHDFDYTTNVMPASLPIPPDMKQQLKHLLTTVCDEIRCARSDEYRLSPQDTGLEKVIVVRSKKTTSKPVIYYLTPGNGALTVSIEKEPRRIRGYMDFITKEELARVKEWIKMNFDTLMDYWADADLAKLRGDLKIV